VDTDFLGWYRRGWSDRVSEVAVVVGTRLAWVLPVVACAACEGDAGRISVTFTWGDIAHPEGLWLFGRIDQVDDGTGGRQQVSEMSDPISYREGVSFQFSDVPNGDNLVLVLEARADENVESLVLYYGISEPFSLNAGDDKTLEVVVGMVQAPTLSSLVVEEAVGPADCPSCWVSESKVTLSFEARSAVAAEVANDSAFTICPQALALGRASPQGPTLSAGEGEAVWKLNGWDLDCGLGAPADGPRAAYVRLRDAKGYPSQTLTWIGSLDTEPPTNETLVCADGCTVFAVEGEGHLEARMVFAALEADEMWLEAFENLADASGEAVPIPGGALHCDPADERYVSVEEWAPLATQGCVRLRDDSVKKLRVKYRDLAHNETPWAEYVFDNVGMLVVNWIPIPGGVFTMGCSPGDDACQDDEKPPHPVTMSPFDMLETEVTEQQFFVVKGEIPSLNYLPDQGEDMPVECVNWDKAKAFCEAIDAGGRLCAEAEWEYAARAGATTAFYCGDDPGGLAAIAWYQANSVGHKHAVKGKLPNAFGLYDLLGNLYEWTEDCWHEDYDLDNDLAGDWGQGYPAWTGDCGDASYRMIRGGSFEEDSQANRVSNRFGYYHSSSNGALGFRCCRSVPP
jgi:formylglycine-generating enzyme required for sulfatase activity